MIAVRLVVGVVEMGVVVAEVEVKVMGVQVVVEVVVHDIKETLVEILVNTTSLATLVSAALSHLAVCPDPYIGWHKN